MSLELNTNGLPLPGRELDAWICEHVLHLNVVHHAWPCGYVPDDYELSAAVFFTKDRKPCYPNWFDELHPVYLPEHGIWPLEPYDGVPEREELYCHVKPCPFVSTTSAFFQVMEAMEGVWTLREKYNVGGDAKNLRCLLWIWILDEAVWITHEIRLELSSYPNREAAYAHAVCCCAWKAAQ